VTSSDLLVVGGGVIGLASAWAAARSGASTTVVDPGRGEAASDVAAGMLAPVTEAHYGEEELLRLNLASAQLYPEWIADLERTSGINVGYRRSGTLLVARDADDNAALDRLFRFQTKLGLAVDRLTARGCREMEPGLSPGVRGGIFVPDDHQVDPAALTRALRAACEGAGVSFVTGRVGEVAAAPDGLRVALEDARGLTAARVVIAAGARSGDVAASVVPLPVRPVKGQLLRLRARGQGLPIDRNLRGLDVYLVPRADGTLIVGATVEEMSYDRAPTAGAVHDLLRRAYELVPGTAELEFDSVAVGWRPGTPDNAPLIGRAALDGVFVATGHFRNGILLAPATARAVATWVESGEVPDDVAPFSPLREKRVAGVPR